MLSHSKTQKCLASFSLAQVYQMRLRAETAQTTALKDATSREVVAKCLVFIQSLFKLRRPSQSAQASLSTRSWSCFPSRSVGAQYLSTNQKQKMTAPRNLVKAACSDPLLTHGCELGREGKWGSGPCCSGGTPVGWSFIASQTIQQGWRKAPHPAHRYWLTGGSTRLRIQLESRPPCNSRPGSSDLLFTGWILLLPVWIQTRKRPDSLVFTSWKNS